MTNICAITDSSATMRFNSGDNTIPLDGMAVANVPIAGKTFVVANAPILNKEVHIQASEMLSCGQGPIPSKVDSITVNDPDSARCLMMGDRGGIDFDHDTGNTRYIYHTTLESTEFQGAHFTKAESGDPTDPSNWTFGRRFPIGDELEGSITSYDIETVDGYSNPVDGKMVLDINLPIQGSIRVYNESFGGTNFEPITIDRINIYGLHVYLVPGP